MGGGRQAERILRGELQLVGICIKKSTRHTFKPNGFFKLCQFCSLKEMRGQVP